MFQITVVYPGGSSGRRTIQYLQLIVTCKQQRRGQLSRQRADPPTVSGPHFKFASQQFSPRVTVHTHAQTCWFAWASCPTEEQGGVRAAVTPERPPVARPLAAARGRCCLMVGGRCLCPTGRAGRGERRGTGLRRRWGAGTDVVGTTPSRRGSAGAAGEGPDPDSPAITAPDRLHRPATSNSVLPWNRLLTSHFPRDSFFLSEMSATSLSCRGEVEMVVGESTPGSA